MRPSSVIAVTRGEGEALEVYWSRRRHELSFLGGFWAFAGGSVDPGDEAIPLAGDLAQGMPGRAYYGCAARELFEEMGLLVTTRGVRHVSTDPALAELRARIAGPEDFAAALRERGDVIDADRLLSTGRWETPEWFAARFDSEFFALALTTAENERFGRALGDHLLAEELVVGEWTRPGAALAAWEVGERYFTLPIRRHLEALERAHHPREVDIHSVDVPLHYAEWLAVPGIHLIPLRSPTIPPATHTNCLVVGEERFVVIDPGSPHPRDREVLALLLEQMREDGREFTAIVLTHHHPDHIAGVDDLVERFAVEVWAHEKTAQNVEFPVARLLHDEERIELGRDSLRCLYTPGHASGHLCFHHERTHAVLAGDLVASVGTILVNPPDGHMGDYLASLARVRDLEPAALYPAHGWILTNPAERLQSYIDHRLQREEKIWRALQAHGAPATAAELVPVAYDDAPHAVWPIATRSALAHLEHLVEGGRARRVGGERFETIAVRP